MAADSGRLGRDRRPKVRHWLAEAGHGLAAVLTKPRYQLLFAAFAVGYLVLYLYALQLIVYMPQTNLAAGYEVPSLQVVDERPARLRTETDQERSYSRRSLHEIRV